MSVDQETSQQAGDHQHADDDQRAGDGQLDADIVEAFGEIIEQLIERFEAMARRFELPAFCLKAMHMLKAPMAMKELGQRIHCDPSFVTAIADMLDSHGLGLREPDSRDRRIKHLRLTPKGIELRERVERELFARMPWTDALEVSERKELLRLLRKMLAACREERATEAQAGSRPARAPRTPARTGAARAAADQAGMPPTPSSPAERGGSA
jgi:MarR family transcriptional regulator, organic hydroperoxide resistance regulator